MHCTLRMSFQYKLDSCQFRVKASDLSTYRARGAKATTAACFPTIFVSLDNQRTIHQILEYGQSQTALARFLSGSLGITLGDQRLRV